MRVLLFALALLLLGLLAGCGGGGAPAPPGGLTGQWVEASPAPQPAWQEADHVRWPTRMLTLNADGTFRYEENTPANYLQGEYTVEGNALRFRRVLCEGTVEALRGAGAHFAVIGDTLGLVEETPDGDRVLQLARVGTAMPAALAQEWLAARRLSPQNADLPLPASVRLTIGDGGAAEQSCFSPTLGVLMVTRGQVLQTTAGTLALRLCAGNAAGQLDILGSYALQSGALTVRLPDGGRLAYVSRVGPDPRLAVTWEFTAGGASSTLDLRPDGTYTQTVNGETTTGAWRAYRDNYLCLIGASTQHTYTWALWDQMDVRVLRLGEWVMPAGGDARYKEFTWQHWN